MDAGEEITAVLPYSPIEHGWTLDDAKDCCLHFSKGDLKMNIKTASQIIKITRGESKDSLLKGAPVARNEREFEQILDNVRA